MNITAPILSIPKRYSAWRIIQEYPEVFALGKYYYIGMEKPVAMPRNWYDIDCHLLGILTEPSCSLLPNWEKRFIEDCILGIEYKQYRRELKAS